MESVAAKNKTLEQKRFFRARMTFSQSLLVTDSAFKLDYASVKCAIFVDPAVKSTRQLHSLTTVAVCHTQGCGSLSQQDYDSAHCKHASLQHSCFR